MKRTLVIWGAGRIGRGFVADIFNSNAWQTVFVDIDKGLVDALNAQKYYTVACATKAGIAKKRIENGFVAVHTDDTAALTELFSREQLLLDIAVHEPKLPEVADMVAPYIAARTLPMDIMMNVNMAHPDIKFTELLRARLGESITDRVGITGIFAMCISPLTPAWLKEEDALALWNNGYHEQAISSALLKCPPPILSRLRLTQDIEREETRKLYTLNMAHALLCYMGLPLGLKTSFEAVNDVRIRPVLEGALMEASEGLIHKFGFGADEMAAWRQIIIDLLENPYIDDALQRLGADTRRKLGASDRLAGPAHLCIDAGIEPVNLIKALYAGCGYENDDPGTQEVRAYCRAHGAKETIKKYADIDR